MKCHKCEAEIESAQWICLKPQDDPVPICSRCYVLNKKKMYYHGVGLENELRTTRMQLQPLPGKNLELQKIRANLHVAILENQMKAWSLNGGTPLLSGVEADGEWHPKMDMVKAKHYKDLKELVKCQANNTSLISKFVIICRKILDKQQN